MEAYNFILENKGLFQCDLKKKKKKVFTLFLCGEAGDCS